MTEKLTPEQKLDRLLSYSQSLEPRLTTMETRLASLEQKPTGTASSPGSEPTAPQAQDRSAHLHGMADPQCPGCIDVVHSTLSQAETKATNETAAYYEGIPGVKLLRERYERLKAGNDGDNHIKVTDNDGEELFKIVP